jgi:hypothetical protein
MVSRLMANLSNYVLNFGMCVRIVVKHSYLKGVSMDITETLSSQRRRYAHVMRLVRPHIGLTTVAGTGTRQPSCCGRKPKAVGQSVMLLPENSLLPTTCGKFPAPGWLIRAANGSSEGRTAVVVRDGNAVHMAKGCRLGGFLKSHTWRRGNPKGTPSKGITRC